MKTGCKYEPQKEGHDVCGKGKERGGKVTIED